MPPNNKNLKSALSRQMQRLRQQVDRTDLKILRLLQQRIKLSSRIGEAKRVLRAVVFVPERERQLLADIERLSNGKLPAGSIGSIYREILSSSRAAQGQPPIGLLQASVSRLLLPGRWRFGACDHFSTRKSWASLATGLAKGSLALALLTGADLAGVLATPKGRHVFFSRFAVVDDFAPTFEKNVPLAQRIFVVTPRRQVASCVANRILILIECKSTVNAVKSLVNSMPDRRIHAEKLKLRAQASRYGTAALVRLVLPQPIDGICATGQLLAARKAADGDVSILGVYPGTENYGG